jgi:RNA polymerase sigma-70 factor, ECF subfamily
VGTTWFPAVYLWAVTPAADSDDALVERARHGHAVAYEALVKRHQETAFRVAYLVLGDAAEAEDAAQEAFIKAYYALHRFRPGAAFRPWLLEIVANQARNQRRASGRRRVLAQRAGNAEPTSARVAPSPEAATLLDERRQALLQAVSGLRDEDRLVVAYRYFLDLSEADMAAALGCARGTVKSRLARALERLRHLLREREGVISG